MKPVVPGKQKTSMPERTAAATDATTFTSQLSKPKQASISKKRRKKKRRLATVEDPAAPQNGKQLPAVDSSTLGSHASKVKQVSKLKKGRKKKSHFTIDEDPAAHHDAQQHAAHVGIDRINSNWKQLQATLKKGWTDMKNQNTFQKEQAVGADFTKPGELQSNHVEVLSQRSLEMLSPKNEDCSLTKALAMDCEMVGAGLDGKRSILARVSLVNMWGNAVYDKHVRPKEHVTDYRTNISGVRASHLRKGEEFAVVQKEVAKLILGRVLVGHSLRNDLKILYLSHPKKDMRDTAVYPPLRNANGRSRALRHIAGDILGVKIQDGEHCSVQDARAAMYIYQHLKQAWEANMSKLRKF